MKKDRQNKSLLFGRSIWVCDSKWKMEIWFYYVASSTVINSKRIEVGKKHVGSAYPTKQVTSPHIVAYNL